MKRERFWPPAMIWAAILIVTALTACGGGDSSDSSGSSSSSSVSPQTYSLSATISGLSYDGLVLLVNGTAVSLGNGGSFTQVLASSLSSGTSYSVTVQTQPTGLICSVSNGTGTVGAADVTSVSIACVSNTTILYSFAGGSSDGAGPEAGLILGSDGNFYGTTEFGGASGDGTVFQITPSGTETVLYSFAGGSSDGEGPEAGLIQGSDGNFYGTTIGGGTNNDGTVFKLTPSGTETVLHFFAGGDDGVGPRAGLIQGSDGNFYGTTYQGGSSNGIYQGGSSNLGTVFQITPSGTETVLYPFAGGSSDGAYPTASLIQGSDGNLYGTTAQGGTSDHGTVFKLTLQ
jgi:uncharacterized repeat protein (TIGR03803 family)